MAAVSAASPTRATRRKRGISLDFWHFANKLADNETKLMTRLPTPTTKLSKKKLQEFVGRFALLETKELQDFKFERASHLVCQITDYNAESGLFLVQPFNQSGDKDGKPDEESRDDIWLFPPVGLTLPAKTKKKSEVETQELLAKKPVCLYQVESYDVSTSMVTLVHTEMPEKKAPEKKKTKSKKVTTKKKTKRKNQSDVSPTRTPTKKKKSTKKSKGKKSKKNNKPLDKASTSSTEGDGGEFTLESVLQSFANPRCDLFPRSLKAELDKHPELQHLRPEDVKADPPEILFTGMRRKGYFKAQHLCRVWALQVVRWSRIRGEYFVVWKDAKDGEYDGRIYFAHAFCIKYLSLHEPAMSVRFGPTGALKCTSNIMNSIRRYMTPYMCTHI